MFAVQVGSKWTFPAGALMRSLIPHPSNETSACAFCGQEGGALWESVYRVLDFGVPTMPPLEPGDLGEPVRCDDCETRHNIRTAYASDPAAARLVYCAETAEGAIRLMLGDA